MPFHEADDVRDFIADISLLIPLPRDAIPRSKQFKIGLFPQVWDILLDQFRQWDHSQYQIQSSIAPLKQ